MSSLIKASVWSFGLNWGQQLTLSLFAFFLAALLGPESYGIVAFALVFIYFCEVLSAQGLSVAIVQRRDLTESHLQTAFTSIVAASTLLSAFTLVGAGWWARIANLPQLEEVAIALVPLILIKGLCIIPICLLRRALDFRRQAIASNLAVLGGGLLGVVAAFRGWGVWALVVQQLVTETIRCSLLWKTCSFTPRLQFSKLHFLQLWPVSSGSFIEVLGTFIRSQSDTIIAGILFGPVAVALLRIADRIVNVVLNLATRSVSTVVMPYLAIRQGSNKRLRSSLRNALRLSTGLTVPGLGVVAGLSIPIMRVFGDEWAPAAPALALLCVGGVLSSSIFLSTHFLNAVGRTYDAAALTWAMASASILVFVPVAVLVRSATLDVQVAALAGSRVALLALVYFPIACWLLHRAAGVTAAELIGPGIRPLLAATAAFLCGITLQVLDVFAMPALPRLVLMSIVVLAVTVLTIFVFDMPFVRMYLLPMAKQIGLIGGKSRSGVRKPKSRRPERD